MAKFTLNDKEYDTENVSEDAIKQLQSLQFCTAERQRLESLLAVTRTAQAAYSKALQDAVEATE